jgi:regulator of RNase E activity RraA
VVADTDGAVLIPAALLEEVVELAARKERFEEWVLQEVESGATLPGLYPPNAETKARYEAAIARQSGQ